MDRLLRIFFGLTCLMLAVQGQETLNATVTRTGCGTSKACFADPTDCDPETSSTCLLATSKTSGSNLMFEMRGEATGYIAMALSTDTAAGGNDKTYICTNSSTFIFALLDKGSLTVSNESGLVGNASFLVNGSINCAFEVSGLNASSSRNAATTFAVVLAKGELNADGTPAAPTVLSTSELVNLADAASTNSATNATTAAPSNATTAAATTAAATTTTAAAATTASGANINLQHTLSQALLILFGVLALGLM